ncbi:MAG: quinone oxidoreductase [Dehalococcoidia bacterium]
MKAIRVNQQGGPEVLQVEEVPTPVPGEGNALVKLASIGVNYIDIYQRSGGYPMTVPFILGNEGAGVVEATGPGVSEVEVGDRVAYTGGLGAYAEYAEVSAWRLVKVPEGLDLSTAAAVMLQGMTAHYLAKSSYPLKSGDACLVHAAAGGTGLLLTQVAKRLGATVFGTVSTQEKAEVARAAGCDEVVIYTEQDFEAEVKRLTGGRGVQVVYDAVGKSTFDKSLNSLVSRGYMVLYGQASGAVPPLDPQTLNQKGSVFLTRPSLVHHTATREELLWRANEVLSWVASGDLKVRIDSELPLSEAAEAHRRLASRQTVGKLLLRP